MVEYGEKNNGPEDKESGTSRPGYINCVKCEHFYITWQPRMPRACRVFGFKGPLMPSLTVFTVTGKKCPAFRLKQKK